ncbi:MAG: response regulator transcription factor [Gaiellaceae bacterium MAG52_C11]|nr:response regulator transcription factor [Candidatus Gaiellasilicea maunaloa]
MSPVRVRGDSEPARAAQRSGQLERGRRSYAARVWLDAYETFRRADEAGLLGAEDLELLATAAYMLGRDDEWMSFHERAHQLYADAGEALPAVRCAFWVGMNLALRGEAGGASGWLGRAQRLLERDGRDCAERGYMLLPVMFQHEAAGDFAAAAEAVAAAAEIGQRFGDADLFALAVHGQGCMLIKNGQVKEGLGLLDEAMVAVTTGELSPIPTGLVYCGVILACQEVYELGRAREWTAALTRWCADQPDLVAFTGRCLVHRAEIMQLDGAWPDALEEARRASLRFVATSNSACGLAHYRQGELLRLQGEFGAAEEAYREASRNGWEPQPGLAQLRLAQGRADVAAAAIRRAAGEVSERLKRAGLLAAYVEIMLAVGDAAEAYAACRELGEIAESHKSIMLAAMAAQARGAVDLDRGEARSALVSLRHAWQLWHDLEAPYEAARVRVLVGLACRALGDDDAAAMELDAARGAFARLGAAPDLARLDSFSRADVSGAAHGLTPRELEVLRLVAAGKSNRAIASALVISEHTVARHVQNIFAKLRVSSRTAAGAFAFEHDLV